MSKLPAEMSPLEFMLYLSYQNMAKDELINLCMEKSSQLEKMQIKQKESVIKRVKGKRHSYIETIELPVFEVFVDLTKKRFPSNAAMASELNRRFPLNNKTWVDDRYVSAGKNGQGFNEALKKVKEYLRFLNKHQI